jgi:hypothetical protein
MLRTLRPALLSVAFIALASMLAGCESFDFDKLDVFNLNEKKKLPGERKALFPEGVPGVTQGVPPELVKGHQPTEVVTAEPAKPVEPEKPKPKPKVAKRPTRITVQPEANAPAQAQPQQKQQPQQPAAPWPQQQPQQQQQTGTNAPWPSTTAQQPSAWPTSPQPGTFQR